MDTQTLSDLERIRGYVVQVIIDRFTHLGLDRHRVAEIAKEVLGKTEGLTSEDDLVKVLDELAGKYPQIKPAEVAEWSFRDHKLAETKVNQLIDLLHQGNIEGAAAKANEFEHPNSTQ
jgi:hypothetical protein